MHSVIPETKAYLRKLRPFLSIAWCIVGGRASVVCCPTACGASEKVFMWPPLSYCRVSYGPNGFGCHVRRKPSATKVSTLLSLCNSSPLDTVVRSHSVVTMDALCPRHANQHGQYKMRMSQLRCQKVAIRQLGLEHVQQVGNIFNRSEACPCKESI